MTIAETVPRWTTQHVLARTSALAAVLALAGIMAAHTLPDGRLADYADTLTPLTGHVLIGSVAALLALRKPAWALTLLSASIALALTAHALLIQSDHPTMIWPIGSASASRTTLRIYELNSWDENPDLPRLEHALAAVDADVIVLAEADPLKVPMLDRLKARFPYQSSCAQRSECATAVLSRLPIIAAATARDRYEVPPIAWARIDARSLGLGEVTIIGTHVHRPTRSPRLHAKQMRALAALVLSTKGPLIVAGDLNTSPWSASFRELVATTRLQPFARLLPTWPAYPIGMPQVAIDHILVSSDLAVIRAGVGPLTGSDHAPVFAEIRAAASPP